MKKPRLFWVIFLGMMVLSISIEPNSRLGFAASSAIGPQASSPIFSCFGNKNQPPAPPADTTPPETSITSNPPNPSSSTDATFEFTCDEGSCTYDCQIDSGGWFPCASPITYSGLFEGDHTFEVKAWDGSGNVDLTPASYSWAILTPWAKSYGGTSAEFPSSIQSTSDGGYIVAASTNSFGAGSHDSWIIKLNSDGAVAWQKTYGGTSDDYAYSIQQTTDGGYITVGLTQSFGAGHYDFWILKLNSDGTVNWQNAYGGTGSESAYSIQQTSDGGYIVAGWTKSFGAGSDDFWILKLNSDGTVAWQKAYGGTYADDAYSIQQTSDGGFIVAGENDSVGAGNSGFWILKLNSNGTVAWQKLCGGTGFDRATSIQQTTDGGYVVAGYTNSFGAGSHDYWVLKLNSDSTVAWQKTYGGTSSDYASKIQPTSDGGYIVAGNTQSFGATVEDFWILKLNPDGTENWQKTYGAPGTQDAYSIQQTSDGGFIVAGRTLYLSVGSYDLWILKLNPDGSIPFNTSSGAIVIDTSATVNDSSVTLTNTSTTITNTSATITNTNATINDTDATINQQAP